MANVNDKADDEYNRTYHTNDSKPERDNSHLYDGAGKKKPKCCEYCGGPYPLCKDGCSVFDD